ncbi:MAG: hypothetical protein IJ093_02775, partial [Bacilli bacterium]|nr:hypothetical protein [Bacilli bacterium]
KHISNIIKVSSEENIVGSYLTQDFKENINFISFTKNGMVKQTNINDLKVQRYSKPITLMKLKNDDELINVEIAKKETIVTTKNGYCLRYNTNEVPLTGLRGSGVKSISLKGDVVVSGRSFNETHYLTIFTDKNTAKRIKIEEIEPLSRARRGIRIIRDVKTNPYHIIDSFPIKNKTNIGLITDDIKYIKATDIVIGDRYQTGSNISKEQIEKIFLEVNKDEEEVEIDVSLDKVDEQILTIDDFLGDLKID